MTDLTGHSLFSLNTVFKGAFKSVHRKGEGMSMYNVGFTTGVFDVFYVGHLNLLKKCKAMCSHLIVAVCDYDYVRNIKHKVFIRLRTE